MEKKLQRNEQEKTIAGVCAGLADYFEVDVTWIRIAFVVAVVAGFSGLLAYIILWIAVPPKPYTPNYGQFNTDYKVYENKAYSNDPVSDPSFIATPFPASKKSSNGRVIAGLIFVLFGAFFLLNEFDVIPYWFDLHKLWPLVFIIPGILMIARSGKKEPWKEDWKKSQSGDKPSETTPVSTEETNANTDQPANNPL